MAHKLITAATALPITLSEVKLACRFDGTALDSDITAMLTDAVQLCEHECGQVLMPQTWELTLDAFPGAIELTRVPVSAITSIKYTDTVGALQTLSSSAYALDNADGFGLARVTPVFGTTWPLTRSEANAVKVRYVAGYADADAVPSHFKRQIKIFVAMMIDTPDVLSDRLAAIAKIYAL